MAKDKPDSERIDTKALYTFMGSIDEHAKTTNRTLDEIKATMQSHHDSIGTEQDAQWSRINAIDKKQEQVAGAIKALKAMWAVLTATVAAAIAWVKSNP